MKCELPYMYKIVEIYYEGFFLNDEKIDNWKYYNDKGLLDTIISY